MNAAASEPLLEVRRLCKEFPLRRGIWQRPGGIVRAVDDVSFDLSAGETLGLVGESGSGKTTLGKLVVRLVEATSGEITLRVSDNGRQHAYPLRQLASGPLRRLRRHMQIVFQNPYGSLNPRLTIGASMAEAIRALPNVGKAECRERTGALLRRVGLDEDAAASHPHAFSGGQLQRINIARAVAAGPSFIVCDEVVSALDVSIQAQTINLLLDLQQERRIAYLFISHDLKIVGQISQRVAVMYAGQFVETGPAAEVFTNPRHPYTRALLAAVPGATTVTGRSGLAPFPAGRSNADQAAVAALLPVQRGCRYQAQCPEAIADCLHVEPPLIQLGGGHDVRCHLCQPPSPPS